MRGCMVLISTGTGQSARPRPAASDRTTTARAMALHASSRRQPSPPGVWQVCAWYRSQNKAAAKWAGRRWRAQPRSAMQFAMRRPNRSYRLDSAAVGRAIGFLGRGITSRPAVAVSQSPTQQLWQHFPMTRSRLRNTFLGACPRSVVRERPSCACGFGMSMKLSSQERPERSWSPARAGGGDGGVAWAATMFRPKQCFPSALGVHCAQQLLRLST